MSIVYNYFFRKKYNKWLKYVYLVFIDYIFTIYKINTKSNKRFDCMVY